MYPYLSSGYLPYKGTQVINDKKMKPEFKQRIRDFIDNNPVQASCKRYIIREPLTNKLREYVVCGNQITTERIHVDEQQF